MISKRLPMDDLDAALNQASKSLIALRGARVFITGGTGFFGHWLVESMLRANQVRGLGVRVTLLTRDTERFRAGSPWIAENTAVTLLEGDVRSFNFPAEEHSHVIHAATASGGQQDESVLAEEIVEGARRVVAFAAAAGAKRLLYVSSGAVHGRGVSGVEQIDETYPLGVGGGAYDEAKRVAERICVEAGGVIARCFAFVGPRLPLDAHFAIGNFIGDAIAGRTIHIKGDGTPLRSYLYMSDLAAWLWTMLVRGEAGRAYNVGSSEAVSIAELARVVAETLQPGLAVQVDGVAKANAKVATYVPSVERAKSELGLGVTVGLREAVVKTAGWYRQ